MKRKIAIAALTAAALIGTGGAVAAAQDDGGGQQRSNTVQTQDRDDDDRDEDSREVKTAGTTASEAAVAAQKAAPGTVTSIDLDDGAWEVDVAKGNTSHEIRLDTKTNKVLSDKTETDDENVPAGLKVSAADAAEKAAANGTVTAVELDDDKTPAWEVETTDKNGKEREFTVDPSSGKLAQQASDDEGKDDGQDDDSDDDEGQDDD